MSLLIRYQSKGSPPKILTARGLHVTLGLDGFGLIGLENIVTPWCSFFRTGDSYTVQPYGDKVRFSDQRLQQLPSVRIKEPVEATTGDVVFTFATTESTAEALAVATPSSEALLEPVLPEDLPTFTLNVSGFSLSCRLFPGVEYTVGSSSMCALHIPIPGVPALVGTITVSPERDSIVVDNLQGGFSFTNEPATGAKSSLQRNLPCTLRILPGGFTCVIGR